MTLSAATVLAHGELQDDGPVSKWFRERLATDLSAIGHFQTFLMEAMGGDSPGHRALVQDATNQLGRWLGFKVEFGTYGPNARRPIQFDGFWQSKTGNAFLVYVKDSRPLRIDAGEILKTLRRLNTEKQRAAGVVIHALILVGPGDAQEFAATLPLEAVAGRISVVSFEAFFQLADRATAAGRGYPMLEKFLMPLPPLLVDARMPLIDACLDAATTDKTLPGAIKAPSKPKTSSGASFKGTLVGPNPTPLSQDFPDYTRNTGPGQIPGTPPVAPVAPVPSPGQPPLAGSPNPAPPIAPGSAAPLAAEIEKWRQAARAAEEDGNASEALAYWEQVAAAAPGDQEAASGVANARRFTSALGGAGPVKPPSGIARGPVGPAVPPPPLHAQDPISFARSLMAEGRYADASLAFEALTRAPGASPDLFRDLGVCKAMAGDREGCQRAFTRCVHLLGDELEGFRGLALAAVGCGERDAAVDAAVTYLSGHAEDPRGYLLLGEVYGLLGRPKDAAEAFENALSLAPQDPSTMADLAACLAETGQIPRADALIEAALQMDPSHAVAWAVRGDLRRRQRDFAGARTAYDYALGLDPRQVTSRLGLAMLAADSGYGPQAIQDLEILFAEIPLDPRVQAALLRALVREARYARLLEVADSLLRLDPRHLQGRALRGIALFHTGNVPGATQALEGVLEEASDDPQVLLHLGLCYFHQQRWEEAVEALEESTRFDPTLIEAYLYLGYGYRNLGNGMAAALAFTKVLNLDPTNESANQGMMSLG